MCLDHVTVRQQPEGDLIFRDIRDIWTVKHSLHFLPAASSAQPIWLCPESHLDQVDDGVVESTLYTVCQQWAALNLSGCVLNLTLIRSMMGS